MYSRKSQKVSDEKSTKGFWLARTLPKSWESFMTGLIPIEDPTGKSTKGFWLAGSPFNSGETSETFRDFLLYLREVEQYGVRFTFERARAQAKQVPTPDVNRLRVAEFARRERLRADAMPLHQLPAQFIGHEDGDPLPYCTAAEGPGEARARGALAPAAPRQQNSMANALPAAKGLPRPVIQCELMCSGVWCIFCIV